MNKTVSNFLLGFLAGAAAGAIAGVLLAPDKGSKTRQNLKNKVKDLSDEFGLGISELIDDLGLVTEPVDTSATKRKSTRKSTKSKPPKSKITNN